MAAACALFCSSAASAAEKVEYDSTFLMGSAATSLDLARYSDGNPALAGVHEVSVFINDRPVSIASVEFIDIKDRGVLACLTPSLLTQLHIKQPGMMDTQWLLKSEQEKKSDCLDLEQSIAQSRVEYDTNEQRLNISLPQAWIVHGYRDYVDPSLWEEGINAALLSYNTNAYRTENHGGNNNSFYTNFNGGINLGAWRLRARGNYSWSNSMGNSFDFQNRYVQRDVAALRSQIVLGESYTTGETFDSVSIRGARIYSDSRMLPSNLSSYAPTVRGVANSNAKITITQGGYKIYETTVPPGPFAIEDLSPSGYGADLIVTIEEADGSIRTFSQPFSSVVQMMSPGVGRWDISGGRIINDDLEDEPNLVQGTFYYGINNLLTGYTGIQATDNDYLSGLLGVGVNTGIGAISFDVTHSKVDIPDDKSYSGQSYRISWNKMFEATNTSLNVAAYRYSTQNYLGLNDAIRLIDDAKHPPENISEEDKARMGNYTRMKNQFSISINQPLRLQEQDFGSFYLTGSWIDYWATDQSRSNYSLGYSNSASWGSYGISVQRTWDEYGDRQDSMYFNVSIPLEKLLGGERRTSGFRSVDGQMNTDFNGNHGLTMSSYGGSEDGRLSYSVNTGYSMVKTGRDLASIGGYSSYESPWGTLGASISANDDGSRQYSANTDGGFVLHRGGLTFSNNSFGDSDTLVLVKAPGAQGARINYGNNTVDRWGYGVANTLSPYRENSVSLDIETVENDVELKSTSATTIPRSGSVVVANFDTDMGRSAVMRLSRSDGEFIPFAADVYNEQGVIIGHVGQGGQAFVRGIEDSGQLRVVWGAGSGAQSCMIDYQVTDLQEKLGQTLVFNNAVCRVQ
nr:outer membrane usher protein [Leminorella richardii]